MISEVSISGVQYVAPSWAFRVRRGQPGARGEGQGGLCQGLPFLLLSPPLL